MVHKCQIMISPAFCFVLSKFWFFWLLGGSKGKKWPKKTKNSVCSTLYLRNYTSYDLHLWCTFVKGLYIHTFFCIFPNLIFRVFSGLKEQKMAQNDKELSVSRAWQIWYLQALIFVCINLVRAHNACLCTQNYMCIKQSPSGLDNWHTSCMYAYFYCCTHDFGREYFGTYAHFFTYGSLKLSDFFYFL